MTQKAEDAILSLQQQIAELEQKRIELMQKIGDVEPIIGESYYLLKGHATVTGFYMEDDIEKVRLEITQFNPRDGVTLHGEPQKWSMPIDRFKFECKEYKILKYKIDEKNGVKA